MADRMCKGNYKGEIMTIKEKAECIVKDIKQETGTSPVQIFKDIAEKDYISMHGPEHHILDCWLLIKMQAETSTLTRLWTNLWQRDSGCRELCADYGESVVPSLPSVLRFLSLMGLDRSQPTEPGEIICNLYQRQSEN